MARPSKTTLIDFNAPHELSHGLLERATCPLDKPFALLKDANKKGLRVRITPFGKHWQFHVPDYAPRPPGYRAE